ncbi:MAG: acyl-CoA dehydrogenase [Hadesarchaea archaeon]|nr:MAG: acyl-CoA dehydrogenase [Hadesarchaea archaeon]TDA36471.1 MAG: acyl-CoA dehydrogenase [Hadesarchaea archaeon]
MDFELTEQQRMLMDSAREIARRFPPEYWRRKEEREEFAEEFFRAISEAGFMGIVIPEKYGGLGLGVTELLIAIEELAANGCGMGGAWYLILSEVFGALTIARHGTEEQKEKYLPRLARGEMEFCMALTEPGAGTNTLATKTMAVREKGEWVISGDKIFISGADRAKGMVLVARTAPAEKSRRTHGISLFLVDLPHEGVKVSPIPKHAINYSKTCEVHIDCLRLPEEALIPPLHGGWYTLLDTLNAERMSFTAAAIGISRLAVSKAVEYSRERKVFEDPIGSYQGLQFPLAEAFSVLECAKLMNFKASLLFDRGASRREVGKAANMAKVVAVEAGIKAVYWAMQIFGGYGYAKEMDVERWWREINLLRLAPVTQQMALNFVAEHVLGMPKSYRT